MDNIINRLAQNTRLLLRLDAIGAFVTALLLLVILRKFNIPFGIPTAPLWLLSLLAVSIGLYSAVCSVAFARRVPKQVIFSIALFNFLYCIISLTTVIYLHESISLLGVSYFSIEILVISTLVYIEYKVYQLRTENSAS